MQKRVVIMIIVLAVLLAGGTSLYNLLSDSIAPDTTISDQQGQVGSGSAEQAPYFKVYDGSGEPLTMADLEGKPAVLNFWASWCGPCKSEMGTFDEKYLELGDEIQFVMINITDGYSETMESAKEYVEGQGYEFPVYFDLDLTASEAYQAYSIPLTIFVDAEGNIAAQATGAMDEEALQQGFDMILE